MASGRSEAWRRLEETLILESKYQPSLQLPATTEGCSEVTMGMRDGSAQVLRCLKVWHELPQDTLFIALNIMDRFLSRMRARPKHLSCIAVSSFHLAVEYTATWTAVPPAASSPQDLVNISQAKCSAGDVQRMQRIIADKLGCDRTSATVPVTAATFICLLLDVLREVPLPAPLAGAAAQLEVAPLLRRLETVACTGAAAGGRAAEVALALIELQLAASGAEWRPLVDDLKQSCRISDATYARTVELVRQVVNNYNAAGQTPPRARQRLMWRLSNRTMKQLRPTTRLHSLLPTIEESGRDGGPAAPGGPAPHRRSRAARRRWTDAPPRALSQPPAARI